VSTYGPVIVLATVTPNQYYYSVTKSKEALTTLYKVTKIQNTANKEIKN